MKIANAAKGVKVTWGKIEGAKKGKIEHPNIDSLLCFVGFDKFRVDGNKVVKSDSRVQFDLNSLAKGYTVDLVADYLASTGCCNYIVEIGGEIRAAGVNAKGIDWRIGVDTPYEGNQSPGESCQTIITLSNKALATSGFSVRNALFPTITGV